MKKLGLHIIGGTRLALGRPRVVKLFNCDVAYAAQVRAEIGPDCLMVARWQHAGAYDLRDPEREATSWYNWYYPSMQAFQQAVGPNIVFEGLNEVADSEAGAFARFEVRRLELMHKAGFRAAVGSWSVGCPDLTTWNIYAPVLAVMGAQDVVALHEYWSDSEDIWNLWHCARWTLAPWTRALPVIITECGRDYTPDTGKGQPGWQLTCDAETFLADLRKYDVLISRYPNIIGATVFTVGNDPRWEKFDVTEIWPRVVSEQENEPVTHVPDTPAGPDTGDVGLEHAARNAAWNASGIAYNSDAAFPRYARGHDLGNPETPEFDFAFAGQQYRGQGFSKGIVYARVGDWSNIVETAW